jgi:hypothetical protein
MDIAMEPTADADPRTFGASFPCRRSSVGGPPGRRLGDAARPCLRKPGGFLIVSSGPPNMYAQAINHQGRLLLEYRDGSPDQHLQAKDVSLASIADALSQWMRGDRTFIDDHEWKPLSI